jgi:hypothetical protein
VIYVDDFLLVAPKQSLKGLWTQIGDRILMGSQGPLEHFLGCTHLVSKKPSTADPGRIEVAFDMRQYIAGCIASYHELTGLPGPIRGVPTPYLADEETEEEAPGLHAKVAQSVLAKFLYAARLARPDLMLSINLLSRCLTHWSVYNDRGLQRLIAYAQQSQGLMLRGHISNGPITLDLFCDADHAGCKRTSRSTSGVWLEIRTGIDSSFPVDWSSKRQGQVAFSTPEAELVSLDHALRTSGLPVKDLASAMALNKGVRESALPIGILIESVKKKTVPICNQIPLVVHEDNTAAIVIATKGKSNALRHLSKTHRILISWIAEVFTNDLCNIQHVETNLQKGDGFTKPLERIKFLAMLEQIGIS